MSSKSLASRDSAPPDRNHFRASGWHYIAPGLIVTALVLGIPILFSLWVAVHRYILTEGGIGAFVGIENFAAIVEDERFWNSLSKTLQLGAVATIIPLLIGLVLATALATPNLRFRNLYITILMLPMFIPVVAYGLIWLLILHPQQGILNYLFGLVGLPQFPWLNDSSTALWTIAAVDSFQQTSLVVLLLFTGMIGIPGEPIEAARIDGAGAWQIFRHITLPLLRPTLVTAGVVRIISSVLTYDLIYILTQGGPGSATEVLPFYIGRIAFRHLDLGYASALSWVLLVLIVTIVALAMRLDKQPD